jgi:hypothetical protein
MLLCIGWHPTPREKFAKINMVQEIKPKLGDRAFNNVVTLRFRPAIEILQVVHRRVVAKNIFLLSSGVKHQCD